MTTLQDTLLATKDNFAAAKLAQTLAVIEQESAFTARLNKPIELNSTDIASVGFTANVEAGANFDVLSADEAKTLDASIIPGMSLVALGLYGKLASNIKASSDITPVFQIAANAEGSAEVRATWLSLEPSAKTVGQAILDCIQGISLPLTLEEAFAQRKNHLWQQTRFEADGKLQAGVSLTGGYKAIGKTWSVNGDNQLPIGVNFGLNGYVKLQLSGIFHLALFRHDEGIRLRLQRDSKRSKEFGLKLGAEADFSVVLNDVAGLLSASLPDPEKFKDSLLPLLEPAQWLTQQLGSLVDDNIGDDVAKQLIKLALGMTNQQQVSAVVKDKLDEALDAYFKNNAEQVKQALKEIIQSIAPDAYQPILIEKLNASFQLDDYIQAKVQALTDQFTANSSYADIVKPLGAFGGILKQKIADLNATFAQNTLLSLVKQSLQDYGALRKKWLAALQDAAHAKLAVSFANNVSSTEEQDVLLDLLFHPVDSVSQAAKCRAQYLYSSLIAGRLDNLLDDLNAAADSVTILGGALQSKFSRLQKATLSLNLFGLNLSWSSNSSANFSVNSSPRGELIAVTGGANASGTTSTWFGNYQTNLGCEFNVNPGDDGGTYSLSFKGSFTYSGQNLKADNLDALLRSLGHLCAIPAKADLLERLGLAATGSVTHAQSLSDLDLLLPITIDPPALAKFIQNRDLPYIATQIVMDMADFHYQNTNRFLYDKPSDLIKTAAEANSQTPYAFIYSLRGLTDLPEILMKLEPEAKVSGNNASNSNLYRAMIIRKIARLVNGIVAAQADFAKIADILQHANPLSEIAQQTIFAVLQKVSEDLKPAAVSGETAIANEQTMPWALTAFALTVANASRLKVPGAFSAIASTKSSSGKISTLILTDI